MPPAGISRQISEQIALTPYRTWPTI